MYKNLSIEKLKSWYKKYGFEVSLGVFLTTMCFFLLPINISGFSKESTEFFHVFKLGGKIAFYMFICVLSVLNILYLYIKHIKKTVLFKNYSISNILKSILWSIFILAFLTFNIYISLAISYIYGIYKIAVYEDIREFYPSFSLILFATLFTILYYHLHF